MKEMSFSLARIHGLAMDDKVEVLQELVDNETNLVCYRGSSFEEYLEFIAAGSGDLNARGERYIASLRISKTTRRKKEFRSLLLLIIKNVVFYTNGKGDDFVLKCIYHLYYLRR